MRKTNRIPIPTLAALAATRGMIGAGLGLLLAKKVPEPQRRMLGWTLFGIGAASTVPLGYLAFRR